MDTASPQTHVASSILSLMVRQIRCEANGINSYELVDPDGNDLPAFSAGAHIDLHIKPGMVRQYSLCNDPAERHRYVIAVLRSDAGQGGSKTLHETVHVQDLIQVSAPRNHFPLEQNAKKAILLAGGIGVTPLKAMVHAIEALGMEYEMHYCARNASRAAFAEAFSSRGNVHLHFDNGDPSQGLDVVRLLHVPQEYTHVYFCGPAGFMETCRQATRHWPNEAVHFEYFKAPVGDSGSACDTTQGTPDGSFNVKIASTGQMIAVEAGQTLADALVGAGIMLETSCVSGLCGTCKVRYLEGEVDHRDYILGPDEQSEYLTACVSRSRGELLVLDL